MIVTKAYIKELPESGSNIFKVEVPLMEDNTGTEAVFDALLSTPPGIYKGLKVGDAVFVTFEDDMYNTAIILGSLFTEIPTESSTYEILNDLKVTDAASLPPQTRFGDYTAQDIMNLYNKGGGADGTLNEEDLKQCVQWVNTEVINSEGETVDMYADKIQVMTGSEYDLLIASVESEGDIDLTFFNETLYFLLSLPVTDAVYEDTSEDTPSPSPSPSPTPTPEPEIKTSWKALADRISNNYLGKKNISEASIDNHYSSVDPGGRQMTLIIIYSIFALLGKNDTYYHVHDNGKAMWLIRLAGGGASYDGQDSTKDFNGYLNAKSSNTPIMIGDILIFTNKKLSALRVDTSAKAWAAVVKDKDTLIYADNYNNTGNANIISGTVEDLMNKTGAIDYTIIRYKKG